MQVLPSFATEEEPKFSASFTKVLWAVLHSVCVFDMQGRDHFTKLFEADSSIVLAVDSFKKQVDVIVVEITELQVVAKTLSKVIRGEASDLLAIKQFKCVDEVEVVLQS